MTVVIQVEDISELEPIRDWLSHQRVRLEVSSQPYSQQLNVLQEVQSRIVIEKGGDASYFGDAAEWQRQQRQDRELPFRS